MYPLPGLQPIAPLAHHNGRNAILPRRDRPIRQLTAGFGNQTVDWHLGKGGQITGLEKGHDQNGVER